jgi:hypothetical protein
VGSQLEVGLEWSMSRAFVNCQVVLHSKDLWASMTCLSSRPSESFDIEFSIISVARAHVCVAYCNRPHCCSHSCTSCWHCDWPLGLQNVYIGWVVVHLN